MSRADKKTEKKVKLSREEEKQLAALMQQARQQGSGPHSAQETIPYQRMWPDGVCLTDDTHYTKTVQFQDINYQLAQYEDKTAIFEGWCDFLNYFDPSISVQFSFSPNDAFQMPKSSIVTWKSSSPCSASTGRVISAASCRMS